MADKIFSDPHCANQIFLNSYLRRSSWSYWSFFVPLNVTKLIELNSHWPSTFPVYWVSMILIFSSLYPTSLISALQCSLQMPFFGYSSNTFPIFVTQYLLFFHSRRAFTKISPICITTPALIELLLNISLNIHLQISFELQFQHTSIWILSNHLSLHHFLSPSPQKFILIFTPNICSLQPPFFSCNTTDLVYNVSLILLQKPPSWFSVIYLPLANLIAIVLHSFLFSIFKM